MTARDPLSRGNAARTRRSLALLEAMEPRRLLANIVVNTLADETAANATTSLREAVAKSTGDDVIVFQAGLSGQITLAGSPIAINKPVTINGPGAATISVSGNNASRVFEITQFGAGISGLTIKQGRAERGGGIYVAADTVLRLTNVVLSGNTAAGPNGTDSAADGGDAFGGAIYSLGQLTLAGGAVQDNVAIGGTGSYAFEALEGSQYGAGGDAWGGAIYGEVTIEVTTFANNTARGGAGLAFTAGGAGGIAYGGAIFGDATVTDATFTGNAAVGGDAGDGDFDSSYGGSAYGGAIYVNRVGGFTDTTLTNNTATGGAGGSVTEALAHYPGGTGAGGAIYGGGIFEGIALKRSILSNNAATGGVGGGHAGGGAILSLGQLTVTDSTFTANRAVGTASLTNQTRGGSAYGGAIDSGGALDISASTFAHNSVGGGKGANADASRGREIPAAAGGDANGGAISVSTYVIEGQPLPTNISRSTVFGNTVQGGEGGWGYDAVTWPSGSGGNARGGGVFASDRLDLTAVTVAGNSATAGLKGAAGGGGVDGQSRGGGLAVVGTRTVNVANSIIATNTGGTPDVSGIVNSLGFNLIGKTTSTGGWVASDKTGTASVPLDPKLGALTNNGGPTQTMLPLAGSPAIDAGKAFGISTDQRGLPRTVDIPSIPNAVGGDGADIGSVEVQSSAPNQTPFKTFNVGVTITIQAEDFDNGGEGVAYHDVDAANLGGKYRATGVDIAAATTTGVGFQVGWTKAGEWLEYTVNVQAAGTYNLAFGVASNGAGGTFHLEVDGVDKTGQLTVPNTGGWYTTATLMKSGVVLGIGTHVLRLKMDANGGTGNVGNFNYFTITKAPTTTVTNVTTDTAAHVRDGGFANTNYGNAATLEVKKSTTGFNREAYLKFNLASVGSIGSAKLRIFGSLSAAASIQLGVFASSNTGWMETGLTWNNRNPAATGASPLSSVTVAGTTAKWYELDVTAYLKAERLAGRNTVTLVLRSATGTDALATFAADGAANAPHLMVTS